MTREEAIKVIRKMLACTDLSVRANLKADMVDACHMAIKALEQQPCEDCISRQEVINCVTSNEFRYKIVEDIKTLPSVTLKEKTGHRRLTNPEWIGFLSEQFDISRTSAKEMLHAMMSVKKEDNFKKQFSQGNKRFSQDFSQAESEDKK